MNIWHELAENALTRKYASQYGDMCHFNDDEAFWHYMNCKCGGLFYDMTPEEQCLFLLFCGESYESV